ncbi:MAG: M15 family metallopeptidase [Elusimicrobia bacterium]|nr:M15 family metallopeptidase [Elusimicrobiota bacterium]
MKRFLAAALLFSACALSPAGKDPLVDVRTVVPDAVLDVRYATADNFLKKPVYPYAAVYLRRSAARRLKAAADVLRPQGYRLKLFDGYRPLSVQRQMWALVPDPRFVADPAKGSMHNRGVAVDLTLVDRDGKELEMPSAYDDFTPRAFHDRADAAPAAAANAKLLRAAMEAAGLKALATEWWHYQDMKAREYPVLDVPFETLADPGRRRRL